MVEKTSWWNFERLITETYFQGSDGEKHKKKKKDKAMADLGTPRERPRVSGMAASLTKLHLWHSSMCLAKLKFHVI